MPVSNVSKYGEFFLGFVCSEFDSARRMLRHFHPNGAYCASCGAEITGNRALAKFWIGERTFCALCGNKFSPWTGTLLDGTKLTYVQTEKILLGLTFELDHKTIAAMADVHEDTVSVWASKVKFWESNV